MVINVQFVSFNSSLRSICMSPDQVLILKPPCRILQVRHFAQSNYWWTILPRRPLLRLIDHVLRMQSTSKFQSKPLWDTTNQIYLVHSSLYALCPHKECVLTVELCPWLINLNLLNFSILAFAYCKCFPKIGQSSVILNHNSLFFFLLCIFFIVVLNWEGIVGVYFGWSPVQYPCICLNLPCKSSLPLNSLYAFHNSWENKAKGRLKALWPKEDNW